MSIAMTVLKDGKVHRQSAASHMDCRWWIAYAVNSTRSSYQVWETLANRSVRLHPGRGYRYGLSQGHADNEPGGEE